MLREMNIPPFWPEEAREAGAPAAAIAAPMAASADTAAPPAIAAPASSFVSVSEALPAALTPPSTDGHAKPATEAPPVTARPSAGMPQSARPNAGAGATPAATAQQAQLGPRPEGIERMDWPALREAVAGCQACGLCQSRKQSVFGVGNPQAEWMIIGEAPGEQEDRQGEPFVGRAGQLLDRMLQAIGRTREAAPPAEQVFIANVLKCRPPANRNPLPQEVAQCEPYLLRQIELVGPKVIVAMGRFAVQSLLKSSEPIGKLRGRVHEVGGVPLIVTYHPAYLLRSPADKGLAWDDLCLAREVWEKAGPRH